jgi:Ca-activated chloride channel homolog
MNAKLALALSILLAILLSACGAAATYSPLPAAPAAPDAYARPALEQPAAPAAPIAPAQQAAPSIGAADKSGNFAPAPTQAPSVSAGNIAGLPPQDTTFRDYGVNPFVETFADHLSTFALDVDTASYTIARQYLRDGMLPPADSVRVEEFINFFRQDYPLPSETAFGLYADGAPSPFQDDGTYLLRVGIQGYRVSEYQRKPLTLTFVLDVSGSMDEDNRLGMVQDALSMLIDRLGPADTVGIVAFTDTAWTVMDPAPVVDRETFRRAIYSLYPMYSTNVEEGLRQGYAMANNAFRGETSNRVVLCSDGVANVDSTTAGGILEFVGGYTDKGISLTSIGVGMGNYNDVLLEQLADRGNGNYAYVDTLEEAQRVLVTDLTSTLQVIALDAKVQVDFNADTVGRYRLIGYENRAVADQNFRNDAVDAGEIGAGHTVTALYAVELRPGAQGRLATVQLRWQDPDTRQVHEINGNFNTWDLARTFEQAAPRFQLTATVAQFAEYLRGSPWADRYSLGRIRQYAARLTGLLPEDADVAEFVQLANSVTNTYLD